MKILGIILFTFCLTAGAVAAKPKKPGMSAVEKVLAHLRTGEGFHSKLQKKVHNGQLGNNSESDGEIFFSKGKMRMEFSKPEKTLLVFDGEQAWQEMEYDDGEKKHAIVTKMHAKNIKDNSALLAALLGDKDVLKNFAVSTAKKEKDVLHFELKPKDKKLSDVTALKLDILAGNLKGVSYSDSLENEVSFSFDNMKEEKIAKEKFQYQPPKGAEVNDI